MRLENDSSSPTHEPGYRPARRNGCSAEGGIGASLPAHRSSLSPEPPSFDLHGVRRARPKPGDSTDEVLRHSGRGYPRHVYALHRPIRCRHDCRRGSGDGDPFPQGEPGFSDRRHRDLGDGHCAQHSPNAPSAALAPGRRPDPRRLRQPRPAGGHARLRHHRRPEHPCTAGRATPVGERAHHRALVRGSARLHPAHRSPARQRRGALRRRGNRRRHQHHHEVAESGSGQRPGFGARRELRYVPGPRWRLGGRRKRGRERLRELLRVR